MEKILKYLVLSLMFLVGCSDQTMARSFGGKATVKLENCQKLVNVTWKEDNLWLVTRQFNETEVPETFKFVEDSALDVWEGDITIQESCKK